MWLTICWSAVILAVVVGIGFTLYGFKRRDQGLLSKGLVVLGSLMAVLGFVGSLVNIYDPTPVEALVAMLALFVAGLACIVVGVVGLVKKDLFWKPKGQAPGTHQEKF